MSFKDILGQEKAVDLLKCYLSSDEQPHAYLFIGQEGVGKYLAAKAFAKALNCLTIKGDSCGHCPSCVKIDKDGHPDVHYISNEDNSALKIERIRQLKKEISLRPFEARKKVFLIDNAHMLTEEAANALLKVLEEPPRDSIIILVTAKPSLLPKTVISRCQVVKFLALKRETLARLLETEHHLDVPTAHYIAYSCEGRIGSALKMLEGSEAIEHKNRVIDEFIGEQGKFPTRDFLDQDKHELRGALEIMATWFRDIVLLKIGMPTDELINLDRKDELSRWSSRYTLLQAQEMLALISTGVLYLKQNINTKLLVQMIRTQLWKS